MGEQVNSIVSVPPIANHDKSIRWPVEQLSGVDSTFNRQGSLKGPYDHTVHLIFSESNTVTTQANGLEQEQPRQSGTTLQFQPWHQPLSVIPGFTCFSASIPSINSNADDFFQCDTGPEFSYPTNSYTTSRYETSITSLTSTTEHDTMAPNTTNDSTSKSAVDFLEMGSWTLEQLSTYDTRYQWKDLENTLGASSVPS